MDCDTKNSIEKLRSLRESLCQKQTQWKKAFAVKDAKVDPMELCAYYEDYMKRNKLPADCGQFKNQALMNMDGVPMNMGYNGLPNFNNQSINNYEQRPMVGLPQPIPYDPSQNQFQQQAYGAPQNMTPFGAPQNQAPYGAPQN